MTKNRKWIRLIALMLVVIMTLPFAACSKDNGGSDDPSGGGNGGGGSSIDGSFQPVIRFAVTSDIHMRRNPRNDLESRDRLEKFVRTAYAFSEKQNYNKLDGMFFVGDYTQDGYPDAQRYFFNYVKNHTNKDTYVRAVLGNHEYYYHGYGDMEAGIQNFLKCSGYKTADEHKVIGGYHFIFLNMDRYDIANECKYSEKRLRWLSEQLKIALADDPTERKPIFVFHHAPAKDTIYGSGHWASDAEIGPILARYPQVVDFSGHSHRQLNDPRCVLQGKFTALNTGSLAYLGTDIAGHPTYAGSSVCPISNRGEWTTNDTEDDIRTGNFYYLIEVNAKNQIRIIVYNAVADAVEGEPIIIKSVGKVVEFERTESKLKSAADTPYFEDNAKLLLKVVSGDKALIAIPQAKGKVIVQNYRCEIKRNGRRFKTIYRLSCSYLGVEQPDFVYVPVSDLLPNTEYTMDVYPVNSWAKKGNPISITFKTAKDSGEIGADILSLQFNNDGTAVNTLTNNKLGVSGRPKVVKDPKLNKNVGVFNGSSAYRFDDMADWYDFMKNSFSVEANLYFDNIPAEGYVDAVSNQEGGGFGFECKSDGKIYFYCHVNGKYYSPSVRIRAKEYMHLVGTFDGLALRLFLNGELVSTVNVSTKDEKVTMDYPFYQTRFLVIGGDSAADDRCSSFMTGKISAVNLYSSALTTGQVAALSAKNK